MNTSLDGIVTVVKTETGGINWNWDDEVRRFCISNLTDVDCILLGRNTAEVFIPHWKGVSNDPQHQDYEFGKLLTDIPKVVFSDKLKSSSWENTTIVKGDIAEETNNLKKESGKNILVYGGSSFVSSLIQHRVIDEYYFLLNPVALGGGETIFKSIKEDLHLTLAKCETFTCGNVLLSYIPKR